MTLSPPQLFPLLALLIASVSCLTPATSHADGEAQARPVVVMFGDSTTDRGMPTAVKKKLDELITDAAARPEVVNAGKGGDNATSAL